MPNKEKPGAGKGRPTSQGSATPSSTSTPSSSSGSGGGHKPTPRPISASDRALRERERQERITRQQARAQDQQKNEARRAVKADKSLTTPQLAAIVVVILLLFSAMVALAAYNNKSTATASATVTPLSADAQKALGLRSAGDQAFTEQRYPDAISQYTQAIQLQPNDVGNVQARMNLGISYYKTHDYANAEKTLVAVTQALEANKLDDAAHIDAHLYLARTYRDKPTPDIDQALYQYNQAELIGDGSPDSVQAAKERDLLIKHLPAPTEVPTIAAPTPFPSATVAPVGPVPGSTAKP